MLMEAILEKTIEQAESGELADSPEVQEALATNPRLQSILQRELALELERDDMLRKFGPEHRSVLSMETRLATVRRKTEEIRNNLLESSVESVLENRKLIVADIVARQEQVQEQFLKVSATSPWHRCFTEHGLPRPSAYACRAKAANHNREVKMDVRAERE